MAGIKVVSGNHANLVAALGHDHCKQAPGVRFAIVNVSLFAFDLLLVDRMKSSMAGFAAFEDGLVAAGLCGVVVFFLANRLLKLPNSSREKGSD